MGHEMQKNIRAELGSIHSSLEFTSDQVNALDQTIQKQEGKIKSLENKNTKNKNLELRIAALEQKIDDMDQKFLTTSLEIAGIPELTPESEKVIPLVEEIAKKLEMNIGDIQTTNFATS